MSRFQRIKEARERSIKIRDARQYKQGRRGQFATIDTDVVFSYGRGEVKQ